MIHSRGDGGVRMRCADAVHARMFDDELIVLDLAKGEYFALDDIGARLWSGLLRGNTIEQIARDVVEAYDVNLEQAAADLQCLTEELLAKGLLVRSEEEHRT